MKRTRRTLLLGVAGLLLIAAIVCGSLMRNATHGAADPDSHEITTAEVNTTVRERITRLDPDVMTEAAVRGAIEDQLPALGVRGFIRLSIPSKHIDVLIGTDYNFDQVLGSATGENSWQYRMSLAPVNAPEELQSLYVTYMSTGMGNISGELMIGSAGPTAAQVSTSLSLMIAMWACLCLVAVCVIAVLLLPGNYVIRRGR